jgi:hypothetical protein
MRHDRRTSGTHYIPPTVQNRCTFQFCTAKRQGTMQIALTQRKRSQTMRFLRYSWQGQQAFSPSALAIVHNFRTSGSASAEGH